MTSPDTPLPNFFIAGFPRAGTTSLYFHLNQHPKVYMSPTKEPTFFGAADLMSSPHRDHVLPLVEGDRSASRTHLGMRLVLAWEDYLELFRGVRDEIAIGEASVSYCWLPSAARAIQARVPNARLIFVLRDPADRLFSQYLARLWSDPRARFRSLFLAGMDARHPWSANVEAGRYATQLQRFFELFPRDQLRIYLYEDYQADPRAVLRDVFAFLEVDPNHPIDPSARHNEAAIPGYPLLHALWRSVFRGLPLLRWLPEPVSRAVRARYFRPRSEVGIRMDPVDRQMVIDHYRDEVIRVSELIGRDLSLWLR